MREAHLSTQHPEAQQDARLSRPHADPRRSSSHPGASSARPGPAVGLTDPIRDRATFAALAHARPRRHGPVSLRAVEAVGATRPRVAFAIPKTAGNAVVRNRIRRRLRAVVAETGVLEPGTAYLFSASRPVASMPYPDLAESVKALVRGVHGASGTDR